MEKYILDNDITAMYISASSFPDGVLAAHQKLHSLIPFSTNRKYFGISQGNENGGIHYKAAAEQLSDGEAKEKGLETFVIKKGEYRSVIIHDYIQDIPAIDSTFQQLIALPNLDPNGACVEWYISDKDVQCMVRVIAN